MRLFFWTAIALLAAAPAHAAPVGAAIAAIFSGIGGTVLGSFVIRLGVSLALSALARALGPKPKQQRAPGIKTEVTTTGGVEPQSFVFGWYATAGNHVCPPMSHGQAGDTPNAYLTYVIDLGDKPFTSLDKVIVNSEEIALSETVHADYGTEAAGDYAGKLWVKFYDGTQTAADPMLIAKYGSDPDRPWSADMVGTGVPYLVFTFKYDRETFNGLPQCRAVVNGLALYDPRKDSSAGGSGTHRWADPATWEFTRNPVVMVYNILRGITLADGSTWGLDVSETDLDLSGWAAAMNVCEEQVAVGDGSTTQNRYSAGLDVSVDQEPLEVIDELLKACSGDVVEVGGEWFVRVGPVGLPTYFLTDEDILRSGEQQLEPFPGLDSTFNGVHASYPDPDALWESKDAPPRYNADFEAEDQNRRLVADLALSAVPYPDQVQRLMRAYIEDERRFRQHGITLPPEAIHVRPLDVIAWTSARNGYDAKLFEISGKTLATKTLNSQHQVRERDPSDYDWTPDFELPYDNPPVTVVTPAPVAVPGFAVEPASVVDSAGQNRLPAIQLRWNAELTGVRAIRWAVRLQSSGLVVAGNSTHDVEAGQTLIVNGILPDTGYQVRARLVTDIPNAWTGWINVTTPDVRLGLGDLDASVEQAIDNAQAAADALAADQAAAQVQENLDNAVTSLTVDYNATQIAAQNASDAQAATESARDLTIAARDAAQLAETNAESAETNAETARDQAQTARSAAETAQAAAESAEVSASASAGVAASAQTAAEDAAALSGPSTLVEPAAAWTHLSASTVGTILKTPINFGAFVTNDTDFGAAYVFPDGGNRTVGQAIGFEYEHGRTYEALFRFKVHNDGSTNGTQARFGITTQNGTTIRNGNVQTPAIVYAVGDGVQEVRVQFASTPDANSSPDYTVAIPSASADANRAYIHFRQNQGSATDAVCTVAQISIRDVTDALAAAGSANAAATSASVAGVSATEAGESANAAQTAQTAAETAQSDAESAETNAATSATNAAGSAASAASSATNAANSANNAGGSAAAASTSASQAETSATDAQQSASASASSASEAATDAGSAQTYANQAATSATNAAGSANAASTSEGVAAQAAQNAGNSATAASTSASNAASSANDAGTSATAAANSATTAATEAGDAATYASQAATSETNAAGSAQAAAASEGVVAQVQDQVETTVAALGPTDFNTPTAAWNYNTNHMNSTPASKATIQPADVIAGDADFGTCFEFPQSANTTVGPSRLYAWTPGNVYAVTVQFKTVSDGTGVSNNQFGATLYEGDTWDGSVDNLQRDVGDFSTADGVQTKTVWFTDRTDLSSLAIAETGFGPVVANPTNNPNGALFHIRQNASNAGTVVQRVNFFEVREVTALVDALLAREAAGASASAAASSESSAAASETAAGQSAAAAQTAQTAAQTARSGAEAAETAAATSASDAAGSASSASNSATAAANSATQSGNSAGAAASSANAASSSATDAAQSATSASTSANTAQTAASGAQASQTSAAQSATDAAGSASAAATSATVAAEALTNFQLSSTDFQLILDGTDAPYGVGTLETTENGGSILGQGGSLITATASGTIDTVGATNGVQIQIPSEQALQFSGRRVRVDVLARQAGSNPATQFVAAYSTADVGNSGAQTFTATSGWAWHSFYYDVPTASAGGADWVGLFGDASQSGKKTQFARVLVRLASLADDIPEIGLVQAQANTTSAAVADLEGNAAASITMRAKAGTAGAELELVAADDVDSGTTSVARLRAENILLEGSVGTGMLTVGLGRNLLTNTDFSDGLQGWWTFKSGAAGTATSVALRAPGAWSGASFPVLQLYQNTGDTAGYADIEYRPYVLDGTATLGVPVAPNEWVEASVYASTHRCGFELRIRFFDANGSHLAWSGVIASANPGNGIIGSSTNPDNHPRYWGKSRAPSGAAFATIHIRKKATNSSSSNSYLFVHKPQLALSHANASAPTPFSPGGTTLITGGKIATGSITAPDAVFANGAIQTADLGDLQVDTAKIKDRAVTIPVYVQDNNLVNVTTTSTYTPVASLVIDREGYSTALQFTAQIDGYDDGALMFGFTRNGVAFNNGFTCYIAGNGSQTAISISTIDSNLGAGVTTYGVHARVVVDLNRRGRVFKKFMSAHQFKK